MGVRVGEKAPLALVVIAYICKNRSTSAIHLLLPLLRISHVKSTLYFPVPNTTQSNTPQKVLLPGKGQTSSSEKII